ncbi:hypothetical protein Tco_1002812 [Tanacetum coccineum]|uniref:Uncharacterized protein n=1 Tax=Tanacetum coccineum TaxID=301880 RepID=A0ABQ5F7Z2_9ASTR
MRYLDNKSNRKHLIQSILEGPYKMKEILDPDDETHKEAIRILLLSLPDEVHKTVDAAKSANKIALKHQYPRLYALESHKKISVAVKMLHASMDFSYLRAPRGGVEEEQQLHFLSRTADLLLPYMLDL